MYIACLPPRRRWGKPRVRANTWAVTFFLSLFCSANSHAGNGNLKIAPAGKPEVVFDWKKQACAADDAPDTGARAFRNSQGEIQFFASHFRTRRSSGESFYKLKHHCDISFEGNYNPDPAAYSDHGWISGIYTEDGNKILALVHNEYQGNKYPGRCNFDEYFRCWRNSISLAISTNGGATYKLAESQHLIAALPYKYDPQAPSNTGYFNPSNIIRHNNYYYAMFSTIGYKAQKRGLCVIRSHKSDDPNSWRAWDGTGFNVSFVDPYKTPVKNPAMHTCEPVGNGKLNANIAGLVFHEPSNQFIITMVADKIIDNKKVYGFYAATSADLIEWSDMQLIMETPTMPKSLVKGKPCNALNVYPSLIDHASTDRSFNTIGNTPHLYFTRYYLNPKNCNGTDRRDLMRIPLKITM